MNPAVTVWVINISSSFGLLMSGEKRMDEKKAPKIVKSGVLGVGAN